MFLEPGNGWRRAVVHIWQERCHMSISFFFPKINSPTKVIIAELIIIPSWHPQLGENTQPPRTNILSFYQRNWKKQNLPTREKWYSSQQQHQKQSLFYNKKKKTKYCQHGGGIKLFYKSLKYLSLEGLDWSK